MHGRQTSIDRDYLTGDPTLLWIEQPGDGAGNLIRFTDPSERMESRAGFERSFILGEQLGERRAGQAGRDAVHADIVSRVGRSGVLGETNDSGFRSGDGFVIDHAALSNR